MSDEVRRKTFVIEADLDDKLKDFCVRKCLRHSDALNGIIREYFSGGEGFLRIKRIPITLKDQKTNPQE